MDFNLDSLLTMDPEGFTDTPIMAFQKQYYFDPNTYMGSDWSASCSPTESNFPSPVDCIRPIPGVMNGGEHILLTPISPFPMPEVPNYGAL
jgi:hypothetical protein